METEEKLREALGRLGYTGRVATIPRELLADEKTTKFLSWLTQQLTPANFVTTNDLAKYEQLKSSGVRLLKDDELRDALEKAGKSPRGQRKGIDQLRKEIAILEDKRSAVRTRLQKLNNTRKRLDTQYAEVARRRDSVLVQQSRAQQEHSKALEKTKRGSEKVDTALDRLHCVSKQLFLAHTNLTAEASLLSSQSQEEFHTAEDEFLRSLTGYAKKQFFPGIEHVGDGGDSSQYSILDPLRTASIQLSPGESMKDYERHCNELSRLQSAYLLCESQYSTSLVTLHHSEAARARLEEEIVRLKSSGCHSMKQQQLDQTAMKHLIQSKREKLDEVQQQLSEMVNTQLSPLLEDAASLHTTRILHGDCDLKIARQTYITSKQDLVITTLQKQRARHELLSMLLEVELRHHRDTHRLLSAAQAQLTTWNSDTAKRMELMQAENIKYSARNTATITPSDPLGRDLYHLVVGHENTAELLYSTLVEMVTQLANDKIAQQSLVESKRKEHTVMVDNMQRIFLSLHHLLYGHTNPTNERPQLSLQEYSQTEVKVRSVLESLELTMKQLLESYDRKQKALKSTPLLVQERSLPVLFFTDPRRLAETMTDLTKKVDTLAAAVHVVPSRH